MMKPHYHWNVIAGFEVSGAHGTFVNSAIVTVFAANEADALAKAKRLIVKPNYLVSSCQECYGPCEPKAMIQLKEFKDTMMDKWPGIGGDDAE